MEFTVSKNDFIKALSVAQNIVAKRTTMPILSNFLIAASPDEGLRIFASDLELSCVATAPAKVKREGRTTVNARLLGDLVRELPDGEVKVALASGERIDVNCGGAKFKLVGVSAEEYPSLPGMSLKIESKVPASTFLDMLTRTLYATSQDETRFNLNGICFESVDLPGSKKGSALRMTATDGHRLAMVTRPLPVTAQKEKLIVPRKGLAEIRKFLATNPDAEVGIALADGFFIVEANDLKVSMRLIDGEFPDCSQVLPKTKGHIALVNGADLIQSLRRVMLLVSDREKGVRMEFGDNSLKVASSSPDLGEATEELTIQYQGEGMVAGFNAQYLIDTALSLGNDATISMELFGELGPMKISSPNDETSLAIVMPMRL